MKEEYIKSRNSNKFTINFFYKYYLEQGGKPTDFNTFANCFSTLNLNYVLDFIDRKFELTRLFDKNNNFIKIIE